VGELTSQRLAGRVALITGASRGIGAAMARRYAAEGAHVVLLARGQGGLEEIDDAIRAAGGGATLVPMDLADTSAIDGLAGPLLDRFGRLDILLANAAMLGRLTPLAQYPPDLWRQVFDVNLHANWRLIRALDPLLRASPAGRALFVTSGITRSLAPYWGAYAASKAALEAMVAIYAKEVEHSNLRVNLVNPGPTRTALRAQAFPGEDARALRSPETLGDAFVALAEPACALHGQWIRADQWPATATTAHQSSA
jgi:NAD(P)-dependent dehydrogenase (short-subunit alcohol dehydrogenase family)